MRNSLQITPSNQGSTQASRTKPINLNQRRRDGVDLLNQRLKPKGWETRQRLRKKFRKFKKTAHSDLSSRTIIAGRHQPTDVNIKRTLWMIELVVTEACILPIVQWIYQEPVTPAFSFRSKTDWCTKLIWSGKSARRWKESKIIWWCKSAASSPISPLQTHLLLGLGASRIVQGWSTRISSITWRLCMRESVLFKKRRMIGCKDCGSKQRSSRLRISSGLRSIPSRKRLH